MTFFFIAADSAIRQPGPMGRCLPGFKRIAVHSLLTVIFGLMMAVWAHETSAEGTVSLNGLGPTPTGLAANAFLDSVPVRTTVSVEPHSSILPVGQSLNAGRPAAWRSASPLERSMISTDDSGDMDFFPHIRRTVPLLAPDALDVSKQSPSPLRAMNGPSVGVRWRIPGNTP